ncbi:protease pro-enzyme activation domain-containing protein [Pseudoduganella sp. LjRoot289]|uniref:protease pro-enzyme activation domain-containing protein n=1 Tax=Pseudoduganella sp. LjRoot289 TaxID=3342314 RepID=UPI003ECF0DEE
MKTENGLKILVYAFLAALLTSCGGNSNEGSPAILTASTVRIGGSPTIAETALNPEEKIHLVFPVQLNDRQGLDQYIAEMHDPTSHNYHRTLKPDEIRERFGPTHAQINKLTSFLRLNGFSNVIVSENGMIVESNAESSLIESTFKTVIKKYSMPEGRLAHANSTPVTIPAEISGIISSVYGLDTVNLVRPMPLYISRI